MRVKGDLTVDGKNTDFTGNVLANNITVGSDQSFISGVEAQANNSYTFNAVKGRVANSIKASSIIVDNGSEVAYTNNLYQIATEKTIIQNNSTLRVQDSTQLGGTVAFGQVSEDGYNKLYIAESSSSTGLIWDLSGISFSSSNENAIVIVDGQSPNVTFTVSDAQDWEHYQGWLRLQQVNFTLNTEQLGQGSIFDHVGLSVGDNGYVTVTSRVNKLDRFGWSSEGGSTGVLDLTGIQDGNGTLTPLLTVNELWLNSDGTIKIDPTLYLSPGSALTNDSVLDYQKGDLSHIYYVLTVSDVITGDGDILLQDANGKPIGTDPDSSYTQELAINNSSSNKEAAKGTWSYYAGVVRDDSQTTNELQNLGIYLGYGLVQIELTGLTDNTASLDIDLTDASEREMFIKLTGSGIINITEDSDSENDAIAFTSTANDFTGLINLGENVRLTAKGGSLGTGNAALTLGKNASLTLEGDQVLNGLSLDESSSIALSDGTLELALSATDYLNGETVTFGSGKLTGTGDLSLISGHVIFSDAGNTLFTGENNNDGYVGKLSVAEGATYTFGGQTDFYLGNLSGAGTVELASNTELGNLSGFSGILSLVSNDTNLSFTANTFLDSDITVKGGSGNSVTFNSFSDFDLDTGIIDEKLTFENINQYLFNNTSGIFQASGSLDLTLTDNSQITRVKDDFDETADIEEGSRLTYEMAADADGKELDFSKISGKGILEVDFADKTVIAIGEAGSFGGTFAFADGVLTVGNKHTTDENNDLLANAALEVGSGSTLVLDGVAEAENGLHLASNSTLDFTPNDDNDALTIADGKSDNRLDLGGSSLTSDGETIHVDLGSKLIESHGSEADTSQGLMHAIRDDENQDLDVILIDNVAKADNLGSIANGMISDAISAEGSTTVTYERNGQAIADITRGADFAVGNGSDQGKATIGITYDKVTNVAIYEGQTAVLEATGDEVVDTITANITDKKDSADEDAKGGSIQFTGTGTIHLGGNNSYSGATLIGQDVNLYADSQNALGHSSVVSVEGKLIVNANQEVHGLVVMEDASLSIGEGDTFTISEGSESSVTGKLLGTGILSLTNKTTLEFDHDDDTILSVDIKTDDTSALIKNGTGSLSFDNRIDGLNLQVNDGTVILKNRDDLNHLDFGYITTRSNTAAVDVKGLVTVDTLTGNGQFNMAFEFGQGSSDELVDGRAGLDITNASGDHLLNVTASNPQGAEERFKIIDIENDEGSTFTLRGNQLSLGAYDYHLESQADGEGTDYYLSSINGSGADAVRNISATAGAYTAIASAAQLFDLSLHDRVGNRAWINPVTGEKETTSVWARQTASHERYRDTSGQLGIRNTSYVSMMGADFIQWTPSGSGLAYAGLMGGYGTMDSKSKSKNTNVHASADTDAWGVGVYAGWKSDDNELTGAYVDGWVMFTHAKSDVKSSTRIMAEAEGEGLSASLEAGWGFRAASFQTDEGSVGQLYIEPHVSVTWFGMNFDDMQTTSQDVTFEGKNNVRTRLGARAILTEKDNNSFNAFTEINWVHNTQLYGATVSGVRVDQDGARNQAEGRIGVDWRVTDSLSAWARVGASIGNDGYNEREGSIGVRYQF